MIIVQVGKVQNVGCITLMISNNKHLGHTGIIITSISLEMDKTKEHQDCCVSK